MVSIFQTALQANQALQQQQAQTLLNQARQQSIIQQAAQAPLQQAIMQQQVEAFPLQQRLRELEAQALAQRAQAAPQQQQQERVLQIGNLAEQALSIQDPGMRETFVTGAAQKLGIDVDPSQVTEDQLRQFVGARDAITSGKVSEREKFEEQKRQFQTDLGLKSIQLASKSKLDIKDIAAINDDLTKLTEGAREIKASAEDLIGLRDSSSPAAKLAAVFKFMKALDPRSVVREDEQGQVVGVSGSIPGLINKINNMIGGGKFDDAIFKDLVDTSKTLANSGIESARKASFSYLDVFDELPQGRRKKLEGRIPRLFDTGKGTQSNFQEGQTATNPNTNEKVVFRNGQWQPTP